MTPEDMRRNEASRWMAQAAKDLHAAALLAVEEPSASLFHSQQCAEKSAKALLAFHNEVFRKTHDLRELGNQCALLEPTLEPLLSAASGLTDYAVVFRYLDAPHEPDAAEAESGMARARCLYDRVLELLSPDKIAEPDVPHEQPTKQ